MTTPDASPPRRRAGRPVLITLVIVAVVVLVLALAFFLARALGLFSSGSGHHVRIDDGHLGIELSVRDGLGIDALRTDTEDAGAEGCPMLTYALDGELTIEAVGAECPDDLLGGERIFNGNHGLYRSLDDVADPIDPARMSTPVGQADVFEQKYSEHTNFSQEWTEPVAIVTLSDPVDDAFPSLVVRADKGELSRADLVEVLESLRRLE